LKDSGRSKTLVERAGEHLLDGPTHTLELARGVLKLSGPADVLTAAVHTLLGRDARFRVDAAGLWFYQPSPDSIPLQNLRCAVVDTEATGSSFSEGHRLVEIAIVPVVQRLTGISGEMLSAAPWFDHIALEVGERLEGRVFVGHNVAFDWRLVSAQLAEAVGAVPAVKRLCTIRMARFLLPSLRRRNLDSISRYFGIANHARHRAGGDALATARVLVRLLEEARARGLGDLSALEAFLARGGANPGRRRRRGRGKVVGAPPSAGLAPAPGP
jgi:DNA polymerase-3 subunit epsilon